MANWYSGKIRDPLLAGPRVVIAGQEFQLASSDETIEHATPVLALVHPLLDEAVLRGDVEAQFDCEVWIVAAFLRPNYPGLDPDILREHAGLFDLHDAIYALANYRVDVTGSMAAKPELLN